MPDPCGVMAGNFGDMSSANKYAALAAALEKVRALAELRARIEREWGR